MNDNGGLAIYISMYFFRFDQKHPDLKQKSPDYLSVHVLVIDEVI
jgi:hypothetical protein